ncbi:hypothetical protein [Mycobacterium sp. AZCC_0083]|uniref:hypothetical protein n=1 Tax=Mycobacterium sp. AZCC_0083 TaxID=2735882 RepID=UPI00161E47EF|nr:hypothetical protein [Mycobacterium sp. AZCC_0083]MBB5167184.1 hypothetical protein [Mycobacterium sp. AZCC_0083]
MEGIAIGLACWVLAAVAFMVGRMTAPRAPQDVFCCAYKVGHPGPHVPPLG